jgi:PAS domain S-box-containing protein
MSLHLPTQSRLAVLADRLWHLLTEPHDTVQDATTRRQSRLLAGLLVVLIGFAILSTLTLPLYNPGQNILQQLDLYLYMVGLAVFLLAYFAARKGHYQRAALLIILVIVAIVFVTAIPEEDINEVEFLYYLIAPIMLANVMLSGRVTITVVLLCLVGLILFPVFVPQASADSVPVFFVLLMSLLVGLIKQHRNRLEDDRKAEILQSEERYRTLARSLPEITVLLYDRSLRYFMVEGTPLTTSFGFSNETVRGRTLQEIMPADTAEQLVPAYEGVFEGRESILETPYAGRLYKEHFVPVKNERGLIIAGMLLVRDITDTKQAESQRVELAVEKERVRVLRQFVDHAASHDLRTPLTIMKTSLYLLNHVAEPDKREKYLQNLNQQVIHLEKITENILAMSQLYRANFVFSSTPLDINQIVREVLMNEQLTPAETSHAIDFVPDLTLPAIRGDANALQQAVYHLLNNALNFTPTDGRITVRTLKREPSSLLVEVEDTGIGIPEEELANIFEPFYRVDKARPLRMGEMGLGLTMVKQIAEAHGGKIEVESVPDKGSIFRLVLVAPAE